MRPALTHIAMHVRDLDATIQFYEDLCELGCIHRRGDPSRPGAVAWLAEPGREREFILVLIGGGPLRSVQDRDFSHLGFAVDSREAVDRIAARGRARACLVWEPRDEAYPVGYYCGLRDPDGSTVEFSYGQPLGPGAEALDSTAFARDAASKLARHEHEPT
jgi:catechol 2,3-dioxygenase-like lactoylglutathione lyase family enzyme